MSRRQKKKQEKKRLAKMGILSQKEIQKQRLKEAKREARARRKSIPTRKEREKAKIIADWFTDDEEETTDVVRKKIYNYKYFIKIPGAETPAEDKYTYIAHLFLLDKGSPGDWDHTFTEDELLSGEGAGFNWARGNM